MLESNFHGVFVPFFDFEVCKNIKIFLGSGRDLTLEWDNSGEMEKVKVLHGHFLYGVGEIRCLFTGYPFVPASS